MPITARCAIVTSDPKYVLFVVHILEAVRPIAQNAAVPEVVLYVLCVGR